MMAEWLLQNWFPVISLAIMIGGLLIQYGKSKERNETLVQKMNEMETRFDKKIDDFEVKMDASNKNFASHTGNPDIHVNTMLMKLLDERFDYIKKEQADTRTDIQRIENLLNKQ